uniref:Bacterial sugar transferase domain-containing protein n=1 Tax=candidate division WOR-3 bacterium TaxID=2052148 RepID=A0A7C3YTL0_UNCW3
MRKLVSALIFLLGDFLFLSLSFSLAFLLRREIFSNLFLSSYTYPFSVFSSRFYFFFLLAFIFTYEGLYTKIYPPEEELRRIWRGLSIFFLAVLGFAFFTRIGGFSRFVVISAFLLSLILLSFERWILKTFLIQVGLWGRRLSLIGEPELVAKVRRELLRDKGGGVIIRENGEKEEGIIIAQREIKSDDLTPYSPPAVKEVFLFTDEPFFATHQAEIERMGTLLFIRLKYNLLSPVNLFLKRVLELLLAAFLFLLSLPFFLLIAILVKLTSRGSVFFKQKRIGEGGKIFFCWKFRTMEGEMIEEKELSGEELMQLKGYEVGKMRGDEKRLTRIGRFLRRTSLDELPQFFNLFTGEMALIGPRPYLPEELAHAGRYYSIITKVKPGITGLWQISGRADLSFEERFLLDEYYVKNWSLWLDLYIFLRTFWVILRGKGAY